MKTDRIAVPLGEELFEEYAKFCEERGFSKAGLVRRLIKDFMDKETKND